MRTIAGCIFLLLILSAPIARADSSQTASPLTAEEVIRGATDEVLLRLETERELSDDPDLLYAMVEEVVLPHFDFERISKRVLGKYWRRASEDQRRHFVAEFQTLLIRTYAVALTSYDHEEILYTEPQARSDTEMSIGIEVVGKSGPKIPITYAMHLTDGHWRVYDVVVDGVSLSLTYRNDFRSVVRQEGVDALISRMMAHNDATQ